MRDWLHALCTAAGPLPATLVVVAHPDDETVGAGSRLPLLRDALFVYATDGAPLEGGDAARHGLDIDAYRDARRAERACALAACGIDPAQVRELGCPDQQAARRLPELALHLADLYSLHRPRVVLTHAYEGGHPDHDATAFAVHAAAALLRRRGEAAPALAEMAGYHRGAHGGLHAGGFLPCPAVDADLCTVALDAAARERKAALLACYATQRETLAQFPLDAERFRPAPAYDFRQPPHPGPLLYDAFPWGMDREAFGAHARAALADLGLAEDPR